MTNIYISHQSALDFYRVYRSGYMPNLKLNTDITRNKIDSRLLSSQLNLDDFAFLYEKPKCMHIIHNSKRNFCYKKPLKEHVSSLKYPAGSFILASYDDVEFYVTSPELTLLQMSVMLSPAQFLLEALQLCGTYVQGEYIDFKNNITPITSQKNIKQFNKKYKILNTKPHKFKVAEKLTKFIRDGSASPLESSLFLRLSLPHKLGGYNINDLQFNYRVELSEAGKKLCDRNFLVVDICNPKSKLAIEYDSEQYHDNLAQNIKDKTKMDALVHDGWRLFSVVVRHMRNIEIFDQLAKDILVQNNQDTRNRFKDFTNRRRSLWLDT